MCKIFGQNRQKNWEKKGCFAEKLAICVAKMTQKSSGKRPGTADSAECRAGNACVKNNTKIKNDTKKGAGRKVPRNGIYCLCFWD